MKNNQFIAVFCGALLYISAFTLAHAQNVIKLNKPDDGNGRYAVQMIHLALSHIDTPYKLEMLDAGDSTQARNINDVVAGKLDIIWTATNQEMEDILAPVRIPLYKGMLGHRIFLIHKNSQPMFDSVRTFDDLKRFKFGQGTTWADTKILEANGLTVVKTMKYPGLFYMLDAGRFDAYPRGVQEPWQELINYSKLPLAVEKRIMLVYRMPFYLFSSKQNKKLVADLELGLNRAVADGSFDKVFYSSPIVQAVLEYANLENRLVFELDNPTLSKETPVDRPELWLNLKDLKNHKQ